MPAAPPAATARLRGYEERWREHNSRRRGVIVDAGLALLQEASAGIEPTVRDIARRSGVAKSVVYRQFDGRDDLFACMRSQLTDEFAESLYAELDLSAGSANDVLTRTISAVADFMADHPRWIDLARSGPRQDGPADVDALTSLKRRIARRAKELLDGVATSVGVDPDAFASIPHAVVSMVEGALSECLRDPNPPRTLAEVVADLSAYTWFMLDGAGRSVGLEVDPREEVSTVLAQLAATAGQRSHAAE